MRATPTSFALAPTFRRRMRSGGAGGRGAPSFGIAWLLLALACLVLALPGKAEPDRANSRAAPAHSTVQAPVSGHAAPTAGSASDIGILVPASNEGESEPLPALAEPSAEKEPSGDKYRRAHGTGFPALASLTRVAPIAAVARHCGSPAEGLLPPAHAPPAAG